MEYLVIGVITSINLIIIKMKVDRKRYEDAILDFSIFAFIVLVFSGTYSGMVVGMIASMIVSIYLFANPPKYFRKTLRSDKAKLLWENIKTMNPDGPFAKPNKYDKL